MARQRRDHRSFGCGLARCSAWSNSITCPKWLRSRRWPPELPIERDHPAEGAFPPALSLRPVGRQEAGPHLALWPRQLARILVCEKTPVRQRRRREEECSHRVIGALLVRPPLLQWVQILHVLKLRLTLGALTMTEATVIVIDDDQEIRDALGGLLRSVGFAVNLLASVGDFLRSGRPNGPTCLVLDVRLPGQSGLDFQLELSRENIQLPIVFITGHGDIPMSVQAMKGGAVEFLTKPFRDQDLLDAVHVGLARDRVWLENEKELATVRARFDSLTPREREVMALVVAGRLNKQIAGDLGVSEITVKVHRSQVMHKMGTKSLPELARMADKLMLAPGKPQTHS